MAGASCTWQRHGARRLHAVERSLSHGFIGSGGPRGPGVAAMAAVVHSRARGDGGSTELNIETDNYPDHWTPIGRYHTAAFLFQILRLVTTSPLIILVVGMIIIPPADIVSAFIFLIFSIIVYRVFSNALQKEAPLIAIAINENCFKLYGLINRDKKKSFTLMKKLDHSALIDIRNLLDVKLFPRIELTFINENEEYDHEHIFFPKKIYYQYLTFFNKDFSHRIEKTEFLNEQ